MRWAGRLGQYGLVLWVGLSLNFLLPHLAPGDPIDFLAGDANGLSADGRVQLEHSLGLDGSVIEQYGRYWGRLATGDLGVSVRTGRPVSSVLLGRLPWTLALMVTSALIATVLAVVAGSAAARRRGRRRDAGLTGVVLLVDSMPSFWISMVLVAVFAVQLGWFPSFGAVPLDSSWPDPTWVVEAGRRLVLPVTAVVLSTVGASFLLARAGMISALEAPYVLLAEATGLSPRRIVYRHALRNALLPVFTNLTVTLGTVMSGVVIVETVFSYPGLGRQIYEAVQRRDYLVLQGAFTLVTFTVVGVNLVADAVYPRLDPRVRAGLPARLA